ncbi:MAG: SpoIVB peptidase [Clostridia bacterium]
MKTTKNIKGIILIIILLVVYIYVVSIQAIPDNIVIFEGENIGLRTIFGLKADLVDNKEVIETLSNSQSKVINDTGKKNVKLSLFENIFVKDVTVDVLPKTTVIPVGSVAGIKLYTSGVLVVGMSEIEGIDNKKYKPYENTGIEEGDTIISINNENIATTEDLVNNVNLSEGKSIKVGYKHNEKAQECSITPIQTSNNEYKLGLWVRDSEAGVGTVSFYESSTQSFGALGHGITDIDTEQLIDISSGEFVTTKILNIVKGESGNPGRIQGTIDNQKNIGTIYKNTKFGVYGKVDNISSLTLSSSNEMEVALRDEIKVGKAKIMCSTENGKIEEYEIEIEKIYKENNYNNKSMLIKITDERLLEKTGGIIQGMSGSPIIQNGKFIGAVTHVLVNNPTEGYGVFGDIMIKEMKSVN